MKSTVAWCAGSRGIGCLFQVTVSVLGLSGPATDSFPGMPRKANLNEGGVAHFPPLFDQKHV